MIEQRWHHVLFLHWRVKPELIQSYLPYPLDLFQGDAVISIVPFKMRQIRFPFTPAVPFLSSLWELNLRTYVNIDGKRGVYFFTLDTDSRLGCFIANQFFHLPYRFGKLGGEVKNNRYEFSSSRDAYRFSVSAVTAPDAKTKSELDVWASERYFVFTHSKASHFVGQVMHDPWPLRGVQSLEFADHFSRQIGLNLNHAPDEASYCEELKVRFKPFVKF